VPLTISSTLARAADSTGAVTLGATSPITPPDASEPNMLAVVLTVAGVLMLGLVMMMSIRGRIARRQAAALSPREKIEAVTARASRDDSAHAVEAALLDTSQRLASQLDAKAERLDQLIVEADQRIAALDRLVAPTGSGADAGAPAGPTPDPPASGTPPAASPVPAAGTAPRAAPDLAPRDPLTIAVYELADQGRAPVEIARALDEQIGKVQLILALRTGEEAPSG
jgi:hypothetical protein